MLLDYESKLISQNIKYIAGVDEVGRGALAGPMVIGAVILDVAHLRALLTNNDVLNVENLQDYLEINDSKKLTPNKRGHLSKFIQSICISYSIESIDSKTIDQAGIAKCTQMGFFNVITKLAVAPQHILTDSFAIKTLPKEKQTNIIKGDTKSITIAAASILAKVFRDTLMEELAQKHTEYKPYLFAKNKAYGTKEHLSALAKYGPVDIHRKSYEPIKSMLIKQTVN